MKKQFRLWLRENENLQEYSPSGSRSTILDYCFRIGTVCKNEGISWETLALNVGAILPQYELGGEKFGFGKCSHESVLNALRYFRKYAANTRTIPKPRRFAKISSWFGA